jgi:hypothetical protein
MLTDVSIMEILNDGIELGSRKFFKFTAQFSTIYPVLAHMFVSLFSVDNSGYLKDDV